MALQKQSVAINFSNGLDTKTDPKQVVPGKFLALQNTVFNKGGLLQKRNGYSQLTALPDNTSTFVTTFNGNLTAIGNKLEAYSESTNTWVDKGTIIPVGLDVLPLIRSNTNQSQVDTAISANGLVCTVFIDNVVVNGLLTPVTKYAVADSTTGQNIVAPTAITVTSGTVAGAARVFSLGNYFVVVFTNIISATNHLQYFAINSTVPTSITTNINISSTYTPSSLLSFDGSVANNSLYLAWVGSDLGGAIHLTYIDSNLTQHNTVTFSGVTAQAMSVTADTTGSTAIIWASFYNTSTENVTTLAVNHVLSTVLTPTTVTNQSLTGNLTSIATNGVITILYEYNNNYAYDSSIPTHYIGSSTVTTGGSVGSPKVVLRSVGLASKAFLINGVAYFLCVYSSTYQPTYFISNLEGEVIAKLAYSNGGGYLTTGLPSVTVNGTTAQVGYLYKDLIQAVNKNTNVPSGSQVDGIYSQTGVNLATFDIGAVILDTAEIGSDLHLSGGFLWMYDGYIPVEHNFFLWADNVEVTTDASVVSIIGSTASGSNVITGISGTTGVGLGASISGTGIPSNQTVTGVTSNTITFGPAVATGTHSSEMITVTGNVNIAQQYYYQVTYEWADNQGNIFRSAPSIPVTITTTGTTSSNTIYVPTLRLTYKTANPVKIVIYRWSAAQQIYYQVTSVTTPLLNNTAVDYVTFVDALSDATILGNNIIYTTGGVVEDVNAPASSIMTLFDTRLWLVDAEDPNLLWYSKQVIEATPVEMSDLFTFYVAPTVAAQGSTGPITALAAMDDKLIIFKENAIYYINGTGPDNTGANSQYSQPIFITTTVGCSNQQSIVFMPNGLMFQSDKGIWLLGRDLSSQYIGAPVEQFNGSTVQSAVNVPGTNQIRFTLNTGQTLMYDYYYAQWGTFVGVPAISSTIYQGLHTFINSAGAVYQESAGIYADGSNPVLISFTTSWLNLAGLIGYERFYDFYLLGQYISPHYLNIQIAYDYAQFPTQQSIIYPNNYTGNYGSDQLYGQTTPYGGEGNLEQWRIHAQRQTCQAFQITLTEIFNPAFGTAPGAGFTLSNILCRLGIKKSARPVRAINSVG